MCVCECVAWRSGVSENNNIASNILCALHATNPFPSNSRTYKQGCDGGFVASPSSFGCVAHTIFYPRSIHTDVRTNVKSKDSMHVCELRCRGKFMQPRLRRCCIYLVYAIYSAFYRSNIENGANAFLLGRCAAAATSKKAHTNERHRRRPFDDDDTLTYTVWCLQRTDIHTRHTYTQNFEYDRNCKS